MPLVAEDTDTVLIEPQELESEQELHDFITRHTGLQLGAVDTFLLGSEHTTRTGVRADVLGLAATGHPVIIKLKQARSGRKGSRTALTQALEYAADLRDGDYTRSTTGSGTPSGTTMWTAIGLSAVLFGVGHLLAAAASTSLTIPIIARIVSLNAVVGLGFGWLF